MRLERTLHQWNQGRSSGFFLVADDAAGGFFAINGGALGPDLHELYYWAPDDLEWEPLGLGFSELVQSMLTKGITQFYSGLRWEGWQEDVANLSGDRCYAFYPFLWTKEGSLGASHRATIPVAEAFDFKTDLVQQLRDGA